MQLTGITHLADTYAITERVHLKLAVKPIIIKPDVADTGNPAEHTQAGMGNLLLSTDEVATLEAGVIHPRATQVEVGICLLFLLSLNHRIRQEDPNSSYLPSETVLLTLVFLGCMESQNLKPFDEYFPPWKDGSHKRIRKVNTNPNILLAHVLYPHLNETVVQELESYQRFYDAGLRAAKTSRLIKFLCKPLEEGKGLPNEINGLYAFFVEKKDGNRVKPLEGGIPTIEFNPQHADIYRSKSQFLISLTKNKDHTELIKDFMKLYLYAQTSGVFDLQGVYDGTYFTLIDPPGSLQNPNRSTSKKLIWLLKCVNHFSSVKTVLEF